MFAGHVGVSLAIGRAAPRVNAGWFVLAGMALDGILWLLVLIGRETVEIPADYARTHQLHFEFPYSHGLVGASGWAVLAGVLALVLRSGAAAAARMRIALLLAAAVLAHWFLDALVHAPEMPLAGAGSLRIGLGLWNRLALALAIETALAAGGLWLYLRGSALPAPRRWALAVLLAVVLAFTIVGMTLAPPPPSVASLAGSSLLIIAAVAGASAWIVRGRPVPVATR
jgi:hypothetical protein